MAIRPLNSVAGFSVGETPSNVILANGDITTTNITTTGIANLNAIGNVKITGGSASQVIQTDGGGNLSFVTIGTGSLNNGTSNVTVLNSGNITFSAASNANIMTVTGTGVNVAGTFNTGSGNANVGNLGTAQVLATANITAPQLISNVATGTAPFLVNSNTVVANLNASLLLGATSATASTASTIALRDANGNVSANFFIGNGSQLTGLPGGNSISNGSSNITAGTVNGNITVSIGGTANTVVFTSTGVNIAGYANLGSGALTTTGNANVGNIGTATAIITTGNITTINSGLLQNGTSNVTLTSGANISTFIGGNATAQFVVAATGVNVAGTLNAVGNANVGNLGTATLIATTAANVPLINSGNSNITLTANGNVSTFITGNTTAQFVVAATGVNVAGYANILGNANVGNIGAATAIFTTGNITTINSGLMQNGTSNVTIASGGNISHFVAGNVTSQLTVTSSGANIPGTANVVGNANVGNLGTAQVLATANVTTPQLISNVATGTAPLVVTSTTRVTNLNVAYANVSDFSVVTTQTTGVYYPTFVNTGTTANYALASNTAITANLANGALLATTFVGNVSGNVTSTGGISANSLTANGASSGNANVATVTGPLGIRAIASTYTDNVAAAGTVANAAIHALGTPTLAASNAITATNLSTFFIQGAPSAGTNVTATNSYALFVATGNSYLASNVTVAGNILGTLANGNSNVNIPAANGNVNISAVGNTTFIVTGTGVNVAGTLNATGNANVGNIGTATAIITTGNITTVNTGLVQNGTSNVTLASGANISTFIGGNTTAQFVVAATGVNVAGYANILGNANVGNIGAATAIFTTGNITTVNSGLLQNGTSNVTIASGGNVSVFTAGNATAQLILTSTGANIGGTANVVGNANIGNIGTGGIIVATGNITSSTNLISDNILGRTGALTITSAGTNTNINLKPNGTGNIDANSTYITNVKDPSSTQDAATKGYVDTLVSTGINYHPPVAAATTTTLAVATGGTISYTQPNGVANGIGAYISTTGTFTNIDGYAINVGGTRILIKDEANAVFNGIYQYTNATAITRTTDADEYGPNSVEQLSVNDYFFVQNGNVNKGSSYVVSSPTGTITFGTSSITFSQFSTSQVYSAGTGLTLANTTFSISNTAVTIGSYGNGDAVATFTVNQQGQLTAASNTFITANAANLTGTTLNSSIVTSSLTSVGTLGALTVTGNATFNGNIIGRLANGNSNVNIPAANGNVTISAIGNANIVVVTGTGVNVAGTFNTGAGNANIGNIGTAQVLATANVTAPTLISNVATGTAPFTVTSTTRVTNLNVAYANVSDFSVVTTQTTGVYYPTFVNTGTTANYALASNTAITANLANGALIATTFVGNVSGNLTGILANGTSNVSIPASGGNVNISAAGNTNILVVTGTGVNVAGTLNTGTGNLSAGNISATNGNLSVANVSGNIILGNSTVTTTITWASVTTTSVTANQTIASFSVTGITGVEFLVKGVDATGSKYSVATVHAVTDGTSVDYSTFGSVTLGAYTGSLAVNISGGFIRLQVTPASSNSTVWTTQYRLV